MRFGGLGTHEVVGADGAPLDLGGGQPRLVLTMLLTAAGQVVPIDTIVDAVWGPEPPGSAGGTLQSYVSRLRRELEPERPRGASAKLLVWDLSGYRLDAEAEQVDFRRFELLADKGRARLDARARRAGARPPGLRPAGGSGAGVSFASRKPQQR